MHPFKLKFLITPMLTVHNDELFLYGRKEWIEEPSPRKMSSLSNLLLNSHHNKLSSSAKKKSKRAIKYLLFNASEKKVYNPKFNSSFTFKVAFITLTLPAVQNHTDQEIKSQCLNQFLVEAKKKWSVVNYVWKAERQGNGNLHFHILIDKFIPHSELRATWNRIINKLGYVDEFRKIHHKKNPNSTDIHSLYKVKNVYKYIAKYMTKTAPGTRVKIKASEINYTKKHQKDSTSVTFGAKKFLGTITNNGRIWSCSTSLSNLTGGQAELSEAYQKEVELLCKKKDSKRIDKEYVSCIYFNNKAINETDTPLLYSLLMEFINSKFDQQKQSIIYPPLPPPIESLEPAI